MTKSQKRDERKARNELAKIATRLGEKDDPFAAWERLEALIATLEFYATAARYQSLRVEEAEAIPDHGSLYSVTRGTFLNAEAPKGYTLPMMLFERGEHAKVALRALTQGSKP